MKKLLIATDCFLPRWDGIARFLNEIIPMLAKEHEITVAAPAFEGEQMDYGAKVIRFPLSKIKLADYTLAKPSYREMKNLVGEADIVWTQTIGPVGAMAIVAASRQKKPLIAYIHSIEWELFTKSLALNRFIEPAVYFFTKVLARFLYNRCTLIIVPSREVAELFEWSGIKPQKKVLHMGTDASKFCPPKSKAEAKKAIGIDPERLVVGFCGRIGKEKDLLTLYRAFSRLQKKKEKSMLLIVGQDLAGVTRGFTNRSGVMTVGYTGNVVPYLQAMDVYVLPSLTETSSLSTIEAMSTGLAVIATPVGYVKEYIKECTNGFLFPKGNAYELYKKILNVLDDSALYKRVSENARRTVIEKFSWEKTARQIKEVLDIF